MFRKWFTFLVLVAVWLSACTSVAPPAPDIFVFTDGLGRKVELTGRAQRVVSLAPSNTELLFAVGAGAQVVGRETLSDYPPEAKPVTDIGSAYEQLNTEAVVVLKPDLVLAAETTSAAQVKTLEDLGVIVYWLPNPKDFDGLYENLLTVGQLTGHISEAQKLIDSLKARVTAVTVKTQTATVKPTVYYELDATDPTKPFTSGPGTFQDMLITLAGGQNVGDVLQEPWAQISSEELIKQNPDIILLGDAAYGTTVESVGQRAGWDTLAAVKNKAVYPFDDNLASRPGPRLVDGLEQLARVLHPELFK